MRDFQRKRKIRKVLYSRGALVVVVLMLVLVSKATISLYSKERESQKNRSRVETELSSLASRKEKLQSDIARLKTREGIETEIREQFQVAKNGEKMVVLVEEQKQNAEPIGTPGGKSLFSRFLDIFR